MGYHWTRHRGHPRVAADRPDGRRLLPDGGTPEEDDDADEAEASNVEEESGEGTDGGGGRSNVDVMESGEAEPAEPEWEPPDADDIPDFEVRADEPVVDRSTAENPKASGGGGEPGNAAGGDPTAGRPNDARAPGATRVSEEGTEAYVAALELCARLPDDVRLPEEAADLVPAAVEAELEQDIQQFAAAEFDNHRPHVDTLDFVEADGEVWLRLRVGMPPSAFADLDPEDVRSFALQELEGVL